MSSPINSGCRTQSSLKALLALRLHRTTQPPGHQSGMLPLHADVGSSDTHLYLLSRLQGKVEKPAQYLARKCLRPTTPKLNPAEPTTEHEGPIPWSSLAWFQQILICPRGEGTEEGTVSPNGHEPAGEGEHSFTFALLMAYNICTPQPQRCAS